MIRSSFEKMLPNKALHLTLCCSLGLLPQDRRSHESAAESGRYVARTFYRVFIIALALLHVGCAGSTTIDFVHDSSPEIPASASPNAQPIEAPIVRPYEESATFLSLVDFQPPPVDSTYIHWICGFEYEEPSLTYWRVGFSSDSTYRPIDGLIEVAGGRRAARHINLELVTQ